MTDDAGFLSRWSRRKADVRSGATVPPAPLPEPEPVPLQPAAAVVPAAPAAEPPPEAAGPPAPPAPTMDDVAQLTHDADFSRFVAPNVDGDVRNAALKKLFTDPHFNMMDGLDTYIDDYGKPDPLPADMLRKMVQSHMLGLFSDEKPPEAPDSLPEPPPDENLDLRLQPDHDAGRAGAEPGAGEDAGRQH